MATSITIPKPIILTIAGSDSCAGAGIQADIKTITACGGTAMSVVTAVTAQNDHAISAVHTQPARLVIKQLDAIFSRYEVTAIKLGMLGNLEIVEALADCFTSYRGKNKLPSHIVCDPVLSASEGSGLYHGSVERLKTLLMPFVSVWTPNLDELSMLVHGKKAPREKAHDEADASNAVKEDLRRFIDLGAKHVVVTGGHGDQADVVIDWVASGNLRSKAARLRIDSPNLHGTGCTFASALTAYLALSADDADAHDVLCRCVQQAGELTSLAIENGAYGSIQINADTVVQAQPAGETDTGLSKVEKRIGRLHVITDETIQSRFSHRALARMAFSGGADVVQYRDKRTIDAAERTEVARQLLTEAGAAQRVIINDHAAVARQAFAHGVHLGQEDATPHQARSQLGVRAIVGKTANTLAQALAADADPEVDYIGVGPIYATDSKENPATVLGLEGLQVIATAVSKKVIAIGGITAARVKDVCAHGAYGVAVLSEVCCAEDPVAATRALVTALEAANNTSTAGNQLNKCEAQL